MRFGISNEIYLITKCIKFLHGIEELLKFALLLMYSFVAQLIVAPNSIWGAQV